MGAFGALLWRDVRLAWRQGGAIGTALGFYLVVVSVMPLGLGPDLKLLSRIAPGVLWVALLLAALLTMDRMFAGDRDDGALEPLALGPMPLELVIAAKAFAHWLTTGIPLALSAPLLGLMLNLEIGAYGILFVSMVIGTPAISLFGAVGAALTLGLKRGSLLLSLLILPLYIPVLIFGISAIEAVTVQAGSVTSSLLILAAISLGALVIAPVAGAAALRLQLQ